MEHISILKKKRTGNIFFGIHKDTGELIHISAAERGLACNCKCVFCGKDLQARKGTVKQHHFSHVSNHECLYANEVAIYLQTANILKNSQMLLPEIPLIFYSRTERVSSEQHFKPSSVSISLTEAPNYPPLLLLETIPAKLRLILNFNNYYNNDDISLLAEESKAHNWSCLIINLPDAGNDIFSSAEFLVQQLLVSSENKRWVYSRLAEHWLTRYQNVAKTPQEHGEGYLCYIHIDKYKNKYSARWTDCIYCKYNIASPPNCSCTAESGVIHPEDFDRPWEELHANVLRERSDNDMRIAENERRKHNSTYCQKTAAWFLCEDCNEKYPDFEMIYCNNKTRTGICRYCSRKNHS